MNNYYTRLIISYQQANNDREHWDQCGRTKSAFQARIQDFKLGGLGANLKKSRGAERGAKMFGVFRVKNHNFTQKKSYFFQI